jgi:FtsP/CotA-like multicopper oxidase with cupredoxin domain/plastocyanin
MPTLWIQLEHRPWDICPKNIDRMTGQTIKQADPTSPDPVSVTLTSMVGNPSRTITMFKPAQLNGKLEDALILRRYKGPQNADGSDAWTVPDDRKVNPWDLNELDPSEKGTMGTIPGPVIECNVGDQIIVHFRNMDLRTQSGTTTLKPIEKRCHSLHPHGVVFRLESDGAYPLSPPDTSQTIPAPEASAWASVPNFSGNFKQGDRVPPGGTFTYTWNTFGWAATAGVWLYHDHSICDEENVNFGAIGILVVHNPADAQQEVDIRLPVRPDGSYDLDPAFLPQGSPTASPVVLRCFPIPIPGPVPILPTALAAVGTSQSDSGLADAPNMGSMSSMAAPQKSEAEAPNMQLLTSNEFAVEVDPAERIIRRFCFNVITTPQQKALYLQLFHTVGDAATCINGRQYLGNTPTMVARPGIRMRFGVVGMGNDTHTFHIHGHRWFLPGSDGSGPGAIQGSAQVRSVSQFEDTRIFGPANSFVFTIPENPPVTFFKAGGPGPEDSRGEWHMHCHVLMHMMSGMMGSLLIVDDSTFFFGLPRGVPCPPDGGGVGTGSAEVDAKDDGSNPTGFSFSPSPLSVKKGDTVVFKNNSSQPHSIVWDTPGAPANTSIFNSGASVLVVMANAGSFNYHCGVHGPQMNGTITVTP